jgi:predicted negative regulator of RcsB-dependent stress response
VVRWNFQYYSEVFVSRITRKELKTDKFALEVEHGISFFEHHKNEAAKYGAIAIGVIVLIAGYAIYSRGQHSTREQALSAAIRVQEAPVGVSGNGGMAFPTQEAKDQESIRIFSEVQTKYSGSAEGEIAQYYLGSIKADQGKLAEAEKLYQEVAQKGDEKYASLAKLSLAQIYFADGRSDQGEKQLRDLIANPTVFVSSDQATISLARFLGPKKPAEARKLLEPLRSRQGNVGQLALSLLAELPAQ